MRRLLPLVSLAACAPPQAADCVDLWEGEGANHVQPYEIAVDPVGRRVWSTALASRALASFDADTGEPLGTVLLGDRPLDTPDIAVDAAGVVWVGSASETPLLRYDPATGVRTTVGSFGRVDSVVALTEGVAVLGRIDAVRTVVVFDAAGDAVASKEIDATGIVAHPEGLVALAEDGILLDAELTERDRCDLPFPDAERGVVLADGSIVVDDLRHVGFCGGDAWAVGVENKDVLAWGGGALVLDRLGPDDPNLGLARYVDRDGIGATFVTGKNTGFGAVDPVTGLVWGNSEGTSELMAWDPTTGDTVHRVRTGTFVDGLALDPRDPDAVYLTGRLSDTLAHVSGMALTTTAEGVRWPYSPVPDLRYDRVWVLGQTDAVLYGLDPDTLDVVESVSLGAGPNPLLTFGSVALHMDRGTVLVAESAADTLYEVEPGVGVVNQWSLGGPLLTDPDAIGELLVHVDSTTGAALVSRSTDGRVVRVDLPTGRLATATFPLPDGDRMDLLRIFGERDRAWFGATAFDMDTLLLVPTQDLPVERVIGAVGGEWLGIGDAGRSIVRVDEGGELRGSLRVAAEDLHASLFRLDASGEHVWMGRSVQGLACRFDVDDLK